MFEGRRNVRQFIQLAQDLGLKVLLRIGPWDHGECRNGGHPDWVLQKCNSQWDCHLRSNNTAYLSYVKPFYAQLANQLQ